MAEDPVSSKLDSARSHFVAVVGRKGSGKSELCRRLFDSYPYDKVVIDVTGDVDVPDAQPITVPVPVRFPAPRREDEPVVARFVPDMGQPTAIDEMDRVVGLCYQHEHTLVWVDEMGVLAEANKTPPHTRRALHMGRHRRLSLLQAMPRPIDVDPLVISQADWVYIFSLPNPRDRRRVADVVGFPPAELDAAVAGLPEFGYLRYDARAHELVEFPPLPLRQRARI